MAAGKHRRLGWYLRFSQAALADDEAKALAARELAALWLISGGLSPNVVQDDQRVELALSLAKSPAVHDLGTDADVALLLLPHLAGFQEIMRLMLAVLLAGGPVECKPPYGFILQLKSPIIDRSGGLSCPIVGQAERDSERFILSVGGQDQQALVERLKWDFMQALAGLPREALGKCPECGTFFVIKRKGARFCSGKCSARCSTREKRHQIKDDPAAYERYLADERERAHGKYAMKVKAESGGLAVRRPRNQKTKEE